MSRIDDYRAMAATGKALRGLTVLRYADTIKEILERFNAKTLLDYGCGGGDAYRAPHRLHERWGIEHPIMYDPAFPKYARSVAGQTFDGVICIDVLEHLDEDSVDAVIDTLFGHAEQFVFATVCCRPAAKTFPDGTNLHTLIRPHRWWVDSFIDARQRSGRDVSWLVLETP